MYMLSLWCCFHCSLLFRQLILLCAGLSRSSELHAHWACSCLIRFDSHPESLQMLCLDSNLSDFWRIVQCLLTIMKNPNKSHPPALMTRRYTQKLVARARALTSLGITGCCLPLGWTHRWRRWGPRRLSSWRTWRGAKSSGFSISWICIHSWVMIKISVFTNKLYSFALEGCSRCAGSAWFCCVGGLFLTAGCVAHFPKVQLVWFVPAVWQD